MPKKTTPAPCRSILIVDDHPLMRHGIAQLIKGEPDLVVCSEAEDAQEALTAIRSHRPDLVLTDLTMPGRDGLELIKDILSVRPGTVILVVSMHDEMLYAERVLRAGGRGYIMKQEGGKRLIKAIRQVLNGQIFVSENLASAILEKISGNRQEEPANPLQQLTDRELEVFQLIGQAHETREIAGELSMSIKTVEAHRLSIKRKLQLRTSPELTRCAVLWMERGSLPEKAAKPPNG